PRKTGRLEASTVVTGSGLRQEKKSAFTVLEPKLKIEAKGPAESYVDQPSAYQIVVTNLGTATLNNVRVRADIPPGARAVKISSEGQIFGKEAQWVVTRMSPGDSRTLSLTVRATQPGERTLDLSVRADRGLEQRAAVTTKFIGVAALDWKIVGNPPTAAVGETIRYTAEVKNQGSAPAENVSVRVGLPEAVKLLRAEPADPPPVTGADLVQFPPRTIAPGATVLYTLTVEAVKPAQAVFRFEMTADHLEKSSPVRNEPSTTIRGE
ncbi:MAG TPA: hypothetical protein VIL46_11970, partial [Gemmataceae bacterium]